MPALIKRSGLAATLLLCGLVGGCGWKKAVVFSSPTGRASIEIWQPPIDNSLGTRVELVSANRRTLLFENRRDAVVYFLHVYWSPDETRVGVLATGGNIWYIAFDTKTAK